MQIIKYLTEEEAQQIIVGEVALGFALIQVSNVTEGNFLGFLEPNEQLPAGQPTNQEIYDNQMTMLDVQVSTYEAILMGGVV